MLYYKKNDVRELSSLDANERVEEFQKILL